MERGVVFDKAPMEERGGTGMTFWEILLLYEYD